MVSTRLWWPLLFATLSVVAGFIIVCNAEAILKTGNRFADFEQSSGRLSHSTIVWSIRFAGVCAIIMGSFLIWAICRNR